jgi:hypothetical protein
MELTEKIELNKKIRGYKGENSFVLSLQKQLKTSNFLKKEKVGNKELKFLSDKQYESAKDALSL